MEEESTWKRAKMKTMGDDDVTPPPSHPPPQILDGRPTSEERNNYIIEQVRPPVGSLGFCAFSTSAIMSSNALVTFSLYRALASVQAHRNSVPSCFPSSIDTCRCSGRRSLLFPTMTRGTHSAPYDDRSASQRLGGMASREHRRRTR